jgi:polyhydroxybutyrate depolymerase
LFILGLANRAYAEYRDSSPNTDVGRLTDHTIADPDFDRYYLLYVPTSYRSGVALPLVILFHGGGGSAEGIAKTSRMNEIAEKEGFIVAYPQGLGRVAAYPYGLGRGGEADRGSWNAESISKVGWAERNGVDDIGFTKAVIDDISNRFSVDPARIYAAGLSKGAMMAYYAACKMPETFAAIAAVAGTMSSDECPAQLPVAILHIHGTNDENVPWQGGGGAFSARRADWPPVDRGLDLWRKIDNCAANEAVTFEGKDTKCTTWQSCSKNSAIELCLVDGGGHAWPGSAPKERQLERGVYVSPHFDASQYIWSFFAKHTR